jgi:hypothetical protein
MRLTARAAAFLLLVPFLPVLAAEPDVKKDKDVDLKKDKDAVKKGKDADLKKDKDDDKIATNTEKKIKAGQLSGKIVAVNESKKSIRLKVTYTVPKLNTGAVNQLTQAQLAMQRAAANPDPRQRIQAIQQAQVQMAQAKQNVYTYEQKSQDLELQTTEDVKVRMAKPPEQFDEKGKVKKYTRKELQELKGPDPKLPGYQGEFSDLRQEQVVSVNLVKNKDAPKVRPRPKAGKDADADVDLLANYLPQVSMVMILRDPK